MQTSRRLKIKITLERWTVFGELRHYEHLYSIRQILQIKITILIETQIFFYVNSLIEVFRKPSPYINSNWEIKFYRDWVLLTSTLFSSRTRCNAVCIIEQWTSRCTWQAKQTGRLRSEYKRLQRVFLAKILSLFVVVVIISINVVFVIMLYVYKLECTLVFVFLLIDEKPTHIADNRSIILTVFNSHRLLYAKHTLAIFNILFLCLPPNINFIFRIRKFSRFLSIAYSVICHIPAFC